MKFISAGLVLFFLLWSYIPTLIFLAIWSWASVKFYKLFLAPLGPMDVAEIQARQRERDECKANLSEMWNTIVDNEDENAPNPIDQLQTTVTNTWTNVTKAAQDLISAPPAVSTTSTQPSKQPTPMQAKIQAVNQNVRNMFLKKTNA